MATPIRLLIINPNTTSSITDLISPMVSLLLPPSTITTTFFTCPAPGIPSINSPEDAAESAKLCLPHLLPLLPHHDCFLVACYSHHPLVSALQSACTTLTTEATQNGSGARKYVAGIFEASVLTSLSLLSPHQSFGIVSTGKVWETALSAAVHSFLGIDTSKKVDDQRFAGCETTGLNADQLHALPAEEVQAKMIEATKQLLRKGQRKGEVHEDKPSGVGAICLGCAGMVGLDDAVRKACIEELGEEKGKQVHIVDGIKAGVLQLFAMARGAF
jgi:Asp/Glu/hydantoin racemase